MKTQTTDKLFINDPALKWRILISAGISILLLFLLWWMVSAGKQADDAALFANIMRNTLWWVASLYILTTILQTVLRAERYRSLLKADAVSRVPDTWYMFLITLCRNMFVDMVPARIGEASYVLMLNRGYHVRVSACLSTLFISMVLDILALAVILILLFIASVFSVSQSGISVGNALLAASLIMIVAGLFIYYAVPLSQWFAHLLDITRINILQRFGRFVVEVGSSIKRVQTQEILSITFMQSLGIRFFKYSGLYLLFVAVTFNSFNEMYVLPVWQVLPAFISAEAAASLPLPTFMSFGAYEGGGMLAFSVIGFAAADILMVMFAVHLISQVVDYTLGGLGLLGFVMVTGKNSKSASGDKYE